MEWEQSITAGVMASSLPFSGTPRFPFYALCTKIITNIRLLLIIKIGAN